MRFFLDLSSKMSYIVYVSWKQGASFQKRRNKMTNLDIFIQYGTQMVKCAKETAVVGLVGSGLSRKEVKAGIRKIAKRSKINTAKANIQITDNAVIFTNLSA